SAGTLAGPGRLGRRTGSFDWLGGNESWRHRLEAAKAAGDAGVPETTGLEEIFEEISPIEDLSETMQLSFSNPELEEPKYSIDEGKEGGKTSAAPLDVKP